MSLTNLSSFFFRQVRDSETRAERVYEAVVGIVVDNKDPDKLARVKVRFPSLPGPDTGWWAPMVSLGAGNERGWFFLPEIDDEVLVVFEHGDIRRPMVIGAMWNGKDTPPDTNGGANERRSFYSREGSKVVFDDDKNLVSFEDGGGFAKITIDADQNKIIIEATQGDVCLQAPQGELNIVAKEIKSESQMNYQIDSKLGTNLGSGGAMTIKGGTSLKVTSTPLNLQPGGTPEPSETSASPAEVPDPIGG
jgi:uncharacterized protein involved in type VI secretion and phage assembly